MINIDREEVLVVPLNVVNNTIDLTNGFTNCNINDLKNGFTNSNTNLKPNCIYNIWQDKRLYITKEEAEKSIVTDQIIPYVILKNEFDEYYTLEKKDEFYSKYNKEKTYKNKRSLGLNKHIYKSEYGYNDPIFNCVAEIVLNDYGVKQITNKIEYKGFITDYSEKQCVHLGMVFTLKEYKKNTTSQNKECYKSKWMTKNELIDKYGQFDQWSKFIIDYLVDNEL